MVFKAKSFKSLWSKFNRDIAFESLPLWIPPLLLTLPMSWVCTSVRLEVSLLQIDDYLQGGLHLYFYLSFPAKQRFSLELQIVRAAFLTSTALWWGCITGASCVEEEHRAGVQAAQARSLQNQPGPHVGTEPAPGWHTCRAPGHGLTQTACCYMHTACVSVVIDTQCLRYACHLEGWSHSKSGVLDLFLPCLVSYKLKHPRKQVYFLFHKE